MDTVVISDTSCLIALSRIGQLELLEKLFQRLVTTQTVKDEFGETIPNWIDILEVNNVDKIAELETVLDEGEASAIALALETEKCILIIDEKKGRKISKDLGIEIIGTLKVIQMARQKGIIESIRPLVEDLQKAGFRFSKSILEKLLKDE